MNMDEAIWMGIEGRVQLATDTAHCSINLHDCTEAKNSFQLTGACGLMRREEQRFQDLTVSN